MAYINVSAPTQHATVQLSTATIASTSSGYLVPALQNVTINNSAGVFNWTQLDVFAQLAVSTPATNSIAANMVLDSTTFFTGSNGVDGIFDLSNNATEVYFRVYFNGRATGSKYVSGSGFITNLAPTVNPTAPVWVSPITISVNGNLTTGTV
jgi:hypothetical protein